jgi:hypothetical protein
MLQVEQKEFKNIKTVSYVFENVGDILPMHNHEATPETEHISIVARGSFKVSGAGWEQNVFCGALIDFTVDQWHEFEALEPNSKIINVLKILGEQNV